MGMELDPERALEPVLLNLSQERKCTASPAQGLSEPEPSWAAKAHPSLEGLLVFSSQRRLQSPIRCEHHTGVSYLLRDWRPPGDQQRQSGCHRIRDGEWQGRCFISMGFPLTPVSETEQLRDT